MEITYESICEKLGCEPKNVVIELVDHEDDTIPNPFSVLSIQELDYLLDNDYMPL